MIPEGCQEILVTDAVNGPRSCVVPDVLVEELKKLKTSNKDLESKLSVCRERLEGASAYGQIAYTLAEYIKATERGVQAAYLQWNMR